MRQEPAFASVVRAPDASDDSDAHIHGTIPLDLDLGDARQEPPVALQLPRRERLESSDHMQAKEPAVGADGRGQRQCTSVLVRSYTRRYTRRQNFTKRAPIRHLYVCLTHATPPFVPPTTTTILPGATPKDMSNVHLKASTVGQFIKNLPRVPLTPADVADIAEMVQTCPGAAPAVPSA